MNTKLFSDASYRLSLDNFSLYATIFFVCIGWIISFLSWLQICVQHCSATNDYRLFGFSFGLMGVLFFSLLIAASIGARSSFFMSFLTAIFLAMGLGAELVFLFIQKFEIGHWCPLCLLVASIVCAASIVFSIYFYRKHLKGDFMKSKKIIFILFSVMFLSAFVTLSGVSKEDPAKQAFIDMQNNLAFGNTDSNIKVYFISDWFCPSCKRVDQMIPEIYDSLHKEATFYFIDLPVNRASTNFSPYHLAFMVHNKADYFKGREALAEVAKKTNMPTDDDIIAEANKRKIQFKELPYSMVKTGLDYFDQIKTKYQLSSTPTVIIVNTKTNAVEKLVGSNKISEKSVQKAVKSIQ